MNILLIAYEFSPLSNIASVRPTKLYKYWKRLGHNVMVITNEKSELPSDYLNPKDEIIENDIIRVGKEVWFEGLYKKLQSKFAAPSAASDVVLSKELTTKQTKPRRSFFSFIKRKITCFYNKSRYKKWQSNSIKMLKKTDFTPDVIFSTFDPIYSLKIGKAAKKFYKGAKWIADFRDSFDHIYCLRPYEKVGNPKTLAKKLCKDAEVITTVSKGVLDELFLPDEYKSTVVTNGFDIEDSSVNYASHINNKLTFAITGSIYEMQSYEKLFCALSELIIETKIDQSEVVLNYAGSSLDRLVAQAGKFELTQIIKSFGYVTRNESIDIQAKADVLVMSSWNTTERRGILTGKVFEYLMSGKPIVATIVGEIPDSELAQLIKRCNAGICYEEAVNNYAELKEFVFNKYTEWKKTKSCRCQYNDQEVEKFSYSAIAERLLQLIL